MKTFLLFALLCLCICLIGLATDIFIFSDELFYKTFQAQIGLARIEELIFFYEKWNWVTYVLVPGAYALKLTIIAISIVVGGFVVNRSLSFVQSFKGALYAEFVLLLEPSIKLFWFSLITAPRTFSDVDDFAPLSALNLVGSTGLENWTKYCLSTVNIFMILYMIVLALSLRRYLDNDGHASSQVVLTGFLPAYFLWVLSISFILVSVS